MQAPSSRSVVEVRDVVLRYGETLALDGVDLDVPHGAITVLVGPSGCGKTSTLRVIAGFEVPAAGSVCIDGQIVAGQRWVATEHRQVGIVFQQGALFPHLTVLGNVLYGLRGARRRGQAMAMLELVGMVDLAASYPDELSGGEQQRVALARALAPAPKLVLLDEPFASLDMALRQRVREEVCGILKRAGITALVVTHDQEEALSMADWLVVMQSGRALQAGRPQEIYDRPISTAVARFIGDGQLFTCSITNGLLQSAFGRGPCDAPDGDAMLLIKPEDMRLLAASSGGGPSGIVTGRRFYGHDMLSEVRLQAGHVVRVRALYSDDYPVGSEVRLSLRPKSYQVYSTLQSSAPFTAVLHGADSRIEGIP